MKTLIKSITAIAVIASFTFASCGKYEEGPKISLRSKKARLCGDWTLEKYTYDGVDMTSSIGGTVMVDIEKDGGYKSTFNGNVTEEGKWELGEDKDDVFMTSNDTGAVKESYRILKLKNKEMVLKHTESTGKVSEFEYNQ